MFTGLMHQKHANTMYIKFHLIFPRLFQFHCIYLMPLGTEILSTSFLGISCWRSHIFSLLKIKALRNNIQNVVLAVDDKVDLLASIVARHFAVEMLLADHVDLADRRLGAAVEDRSHGLEAEGIRKAVFEAVTDFRGDEPQEDDITLVILKFS